MKNEPFYFVSLILSGIMVLVYILQLCFPGLTYVLALNSGLFFSHPWTIITSFFIHSPTDYLHLLNNLFFLSIFGLFLEKIIGWKDFLIVFFIGGIVANLSAFTFYQNSYVLGASGAISAIILALTVIKPKMIGLYFGVPMRMYLVAVLWILTNFLLISAKGNIAAAAHLFGGGFGLLAGFYFRLNKKYYKEKFEDKNKEEISEEEIDRWEKEYMN